MNHTPITEAECKRFIAIAKSLDAGDGLPDDAYNLLQKYPHSQLAEQHRKAMELLEKTHGPTDGPLCYCPDCIEYRPCETAELIRQWRQK